MEEKLEEEVIRLTKILESFEKLEQSQEWETLRELVFDKELSSIESQLRNASLETPIDLPKVYSLQGRRFQAKKFDLGSYIETLKKQLVDIKQKLK